MNKCARHDSNVRAFDSYAKGNSFVDWWVERGSRTYLFEAKAYQFSLPSRQTGDRDVVVEREIKKITDAIKQVYKRIRDIPHYPELEVLRNRRLVPVIVCMHMPFVGNAAYDQWVKERLDEVQRQENLPGLKDFEVHLLNVEELELFDEAIDTIELEDVF